MTRDTGLSDIQICLAITNLAAELQKNPRMLAVCLFAIATHVDRNTVRTAPEYLYDHGLIYLQGWIEELHSAFVRDFPKTTFPAEDRP